MKAYKAQYAAANAERLAVKRKQWAAENAEKVKAYQADHYSRNKAAYRASAKERAARNATAVAEYNRTYRQNNLEKLKRYRKSHYQQNQAAYYVARGKRRAAARQATPAWADRNTMAGIYKYARTMRECGVDCHVDHHVPLCGKNVSGLHVQDNLTVLLAEDNLRKSNKFNGAPA